MANYQNLKAAISAAIRTNGNQEITGQVLQDVLNSIVSVIGANYTFAGVATPATNPGTPDQNVMYLAMEGGTYTNFSGMVLPAGISLLMWNETWTSETVMCGDGGVFDISVYKSSGGTLATFADLADALNGGNNIPVGARKGGMSVKFVQSSDNKYVQTRLMANEFTTDVTQWQGVDATPTDGSKNLLESGGMSNVLYGEYEYTPMSLTLNENHYYGVVGGDTKIGGTAASRNGTYCCLLECQPGKKYKIFGKGSSAIRLYAFTDDTNLILDSINGSVDYRESGLIITAPSGTTKLFINFLDYSSSTDKLENGVATTGGIVPMIEELNNEKLDKSDVINDLTTGGINKALSAEQGKVLNEQINGQIEVNPISLTLQNGKYYPIREGGTAINLTPANREDTSCSTIECQARDKFKIFGKGTSNIKLYAFINDSQLILDSNEGSVNYEDNGFIITAPEGSTTLVINFYQYDSTKDKLEELIINRGLIQMIYEVEDELNQRIDEVEENSLTEDELEDVLAPYSDYRTPLDFTLTGPNSGFLLFKLEANKTYLITINCVGSTSELSKLLYISFYNTNDVQETPIYQEAINPVESGVDKTFELSLESIPVNFVRINRLSNYTEDISINVSAKSRQNAYLTETDFVKLSDESRKDDMGLPLNIFGDILPDQFKQKLYSTEDDILVAVQGDSIVGKTETCEPSEDQSHDAPGAQYRSFVSMIQKMVGKVKPYYNRLDSVRNNADFFTKIGTWEQATDTTFGPNGNPAINDAYKDSSVSCLTYRSNSDNASVSFEFDADSYEKCNIVFTINLDAASAAISIQEGDGKMLVSVDRVTWGEANGFSHSQASQEATTNNGVAKCERHRRLWMKKVEGVTGTIHISYFKTENDSKYMYCWGTEMYFGRGFFFDNIGRGGRTTLRLSQNISDIFDRNPDLAIVELPFLNDAYHFDSYTSWKAELDGYFTDNVNSRSYRVRSENYTKYPLLILLPHPRSSAFDENDNAVMMPAAAQFIRTAPAYDIWKYLWGYLKMQLSSYDNVAFIDMCDQILNEASYRYGSIYVGMQSGNMTADTTHLNQRSANVFAKYLAPVFYI